MMRFAHRGAPVAPVQGNTLAAFEAALRLGAEGLESDVRLTADGVPVLVHGRGRIEGRPVRALRRRELPPEVPALADLWEHCGSGFALSLDMADPGAAPAVVALAERYGAAEQLWLTYWRLPVMAAWRRRWPALKYVFATMSGVPDVLLRRTAARGALAGVDALNLHHRLIGPGSASTVHAAGLKLFGWGAHGDAHARRLARLGVDGVFVDDAAAAVPPHRRGQRA